MSRYNYDMLDIRDQLIAARDEIQDIDDDHISDTDIGALAGLNQAIRLINTKLDIDDEY